MVLGIVFERDVRDRRLPRLLNRANAGGRSEGMADDAATAEVEQIGGPASPLIGFWGLATPLTRACNRKRAIGRIEQRRADRLEGLDEAFVRRLAFSINFPFPDEADRRRIWSGIWPAGISFANNVDFDVLARQFKLSGGNIKNVALAAAFLAAADGGIVNMSHLLHAIRREFQKLGKVLTEFDPGEASSGPPAK